MIATSFPGFADLMRGLGGEIVGGRDHGPSSIAVDGPAASGKGTIATRLAEALRPVRCWTPACSIAAVGRAAERRGGDLDDVRRGAEGGRGPDRPSC